MKAYLDEEYESYAGMIAECFGVCDSLWRKLGRDEAGVGKNITTGQSAVMDSERKKLLNLLRDLQRENRNARYLDILEYGIDNMINNKVKDNDMMLSHTTFGRVLSDRNIPSIRYTIYTDDGQKRIRHRNWADVLLLYNTLYELPVSKWSHQLERAMSLLKEGGLLIFSQRKISDMTGYDAYGRSGYLLLGDREIRTLFPKMKVTAIRLSDSPNIWTYVIKKGGAYICSEDTIREMLNVLESSLWRLLEAHMDPRQPNKLSSKDYGFYCRQYVHVRKMRQELGIRFIAENG